MLYVSYLIDNVRNIFPLILLVVLTLTLLTMLEKYVEEPYLITGNPFAIEKAEFKHHKDGPITMDKMFEILTMVT